MKILLHILLLISLTKDVEPSKGKIIAVEFVGGKSHVITYLALLEEMARRGYEITVVGPGKGLATEKNVREISTFDFDDIMEGRKISMFDMKEKNENPNPFTILADLVPKRCRMLYDDPEIIGLLQEDFDLILVQPLFNDCSMGFVHKIMSKGTPLVLFSPTSAPNFLVSALGGYHSSAFVSNAFLAYKDGMNFYQRWVNFGFNLIFDIIYDFYYIPIMESVYREKVGEDTPSVKAILSNASLLLSNGHFSMHDPKPNLPDVVDVGGIHSRDARPLPKELEDFVQKGGEHGFIYFSLGTGLRGDKMPIEKRTIFLNVFSKLKQQVIWKYESKEGLPNLPKNVYLSKWLPQQDLLGHPKIRLFITHCGGGGTEESIYHGVPLIGMPFFGDQPLNAVQAENYGYLLRLDWNDLTEEKLAQSIQEVISNPKYRTNVQRLSTLFRDQIDKPLDRGVYWLEYVMRHKGAPHLRSAARNLNFFQYHSLDVIAAYLCLILAVVYVSFKIVQLIARKVRNVLRGSPVAYNKDKKLK